MTTTLAVRKHARVIVVAASLLLAASPTRAAAQDQVELWGAWGWWSGKDAEVLKPGTALGAAYLADIRWWLDIGGDIGFGRFDYKVDADRTERIDEFQISSAVRRWVGKRSHVKTFVGARLGYTRLSLDLTDVRLEKNGLLAGPVAGIVIPTGNRLSPTLSFEALHQNYADTRIFLEGQDIPETGGASWRFQVKMGLTFGSGWKRKTR